MTDDEEPTVGMKLFRTDRPKPRHWPPLSEPQDIADALRYVRYRDPIGNRVHHVLAITICVMLPLSTAASAIASALVAGYAILRLPNTWRCYSPLLRIPVIWALALFAAWCALSILWSSDAPQGLDELAAARLFAAPLVLWPVIDRAHWFIGALLAGVAMQNVVQLMQGLGVADASILSGDLHGASGRLGGWLHPIQTGAWCAAALCWHVSAALTARPTWLKALSLAGALAAGLGLLATGSRGPWLAAAVAVPLCLLVIAARRPAARRGAAVLAGAGIIAVVLTAMFAGGMLRERVQGAHDEFEAAREEQVYWSSTGLRLALWSWSIDIWQKSPIVGEGAGSFRTELQAQPGYQDALKRFEQAQQEGDTPPSDYLNRAHAHSTYLHVLAGTGLVGVAILVALLVLAARRAWLDPPTHPYVDGTIAVLAVWIVGAQFDCYHLNGHLIGMLAMAITFTLPHRAVALSDADNETLSGAGP